MEREGYDRTNLTLPGQQLQLIQAVHATGTPTVVVLINSGGIAAPWVYDNIPSVLEAYLLRSKDTLSASESPLCLSADDT